MRAAPELGVTGRRVYLEVPNETTIPALWQLAVDPVTGFRWRFHGMNLGPQTFAQLLWEGITFQFVARSRETHEPVVYVVAHGLDRANGTISMSVHGWPNWMGSPALWEGIFLFLRYTFTTFNVRKVYGEVPEFNLAQFISGAGSVFRVEARLKDRLFYDNMYWDQIIASVSREDFDAIEQQFGSHFVAP